MDHRIISKVKVRRVRHTYTDEDRAKIMKYFTTHNDNRDSVIAKATGFPENFVFRVITIHYQKLMKEKRKRDDIIEFKNKKFNN